MWRLIPSFAPVKSAHHAAADRGHIPQFAHPGGKCRLAKKIVGLLPPSGHRFVDVFAGRGNITWAVMQLCNYKCHWLNDLQTFDFFKVLKQNIIRYIVPESNRKLY
jgi:site-specific DNA-adenine methylase